MNPVHDLTGQEFGRLTVIGPGEDYVRPNGSRQIRWKCRCKCGNVVNVLPSNLMTGNTMSCGCGKKSWYKFTEEERRKMSIPKPAPITIQDELIIGAKYIVNREVLVLTGLYQTFARFRKKNGTHVCYLYWDLDQWQKEARAR